MSCFTNNSKYCIRLYHNLIFINRSSSLLLQIKIPKYVINGIPKQSESSYFQHGNSFYHTSSNGNFNNDYHYNQHQKQQYNQQNSYHSINQSTSTNNSYWKLFIGNVDCFSLFRKYDNDDDDTPESKMIMVIKRSILCIQREEWDKAEQMLHLALRMAQDLQSRDGITFIYDIMANLAMETEQYKKAEKLFVIVMQRLTQDNYKDDDIKMLHINSKISHMAAVQGNLEKALLGFQWTLDKLESKRKVQPEDEDLLELWGLTKDCYAQLLMQLGKYLEARNYFTEAYNIYTQIHGRNNIEVILLLNNLGVVCTNLNDLVAAEVYLIEALELVKNFPDLESSGIFQANRGLLLMKQGLVQQAKTLCSNAWRLATNNQNKNGLEQANYCLKQLEEFT